MKGRYFARYVKTKFAESVTRGSTISVKSNRFQFYIYCKCKNNHCDFTFTANVKVPF